MINIPDELARLVAENVSVIAGYVFAGLTALAAAHSRDWFSSRRSAREPCRQAKRNIQTTIFLSQVLGDIGCDRVTVNQFHNGDHFASGASVQKVTLTHFVYRPGLAEPQDLGINGTPATVMAHLLDGVFTDGYRVTRDFLADDQWVSRYQSANGLRTVVHCLIPGTRPKEAYGLMAFAWMDSTPVTPEQIDTMRDHARRVAAFL